MSCERCGGRSKGRYCRQCERELRRKEGSSFDFVAAASEAFLGEEPPHRCDICEAIVEDEAELKQDCPHGRNGGASA